MNMKPDSMERWTRDNAADLYGIRNWGHGYFDISERGEVEVRPLGNGSEQAISIMDVLSGLKQRGQSLPVLLRFADILSSRIEQLYGAFNAAISELGYQGVYRGVQEGLGSGRAGVGHAIPGWLRS